MCGIQGKLNFDGQPVTKQELVAMNQCLKHRGPDDSGFYLDGPVGLGQNRLAIIDLSPTGHQPMSNEDGTVWIVFNGEIYNFQELRPELEQKGHKFRSKSDTEVIIHAYEEYGEDGCLQRLRGMFAFAIWDGKHQKLVLARDRIGKKPLKYYLDDKGLIFASELKAILTDPRVKVEPDYQAIDWYLTHMSVPAPKTGFTTIHKLPQAHYLVCQNNRITIKKYWDLYYQPNHSLSDNEWYEQLLSTLDEAVKLRMISDVPIGAFLSGGTDSSAVVASMARQSAKPVKTFSIGFGDKRYNELSYAKMVAQQYQTDHTELIVEPKGFDMLPKLIWHYEEPYADSSALPTYFVSEITRKHVTVALNGDGGDENFAGYPWYKIINWFNRLEPMRPLVAFGVPIGNWIYGHNPKSLTRDTSAFWQSWRYPQPGRHMLWMAYFSDFEKDRLYTSFMRQYRTQSPAFASSIRAHGKHPLDNALYTDIMHYLADELVVKVDIASMAVALETRSPLLDHKFMELCATIPAKKKIHGRHTKWIFKKALESRLPKEVLYRKKQGFSIPVDRWFREDLKGIAREILLDRQTINRNIFQEKTLTELLDQHESGRINHGKRIWSLITLELWFRKFFDISSNHQSTIKQMSNLHQSIPINLARITQ